MSYGLSFRLVLLSTSPRGASTEHVGLTNGGWNLLFIPWGMYIMDYM